MSVHRRKKLECAVHHSILVKEQVVDSENAATGQKVNGEERGPFYSRTVLLEISKGTREDFWVHF